MSGPDNGIECMGVERAGKGTAMPSRSRACTSTQTPCMHSLVKQQAHADVDWFLQTGRAGRRRTSLFKQVLHMPAFAHLQHLHAQSLTLCPGTRSLKLC